MNRCSSDCEPVPMTEREGIETRRGGAGHNECVGTRHPRICEIHRPQALGSDRAIRGADVAGTQPRVGGNGRENPNVGLWRWIWAPSRTRCSLRLTRMPPSGG